jgi:hypothetical protein
MVAVLAERNAELEAEVRALRAERDALQASLKHSEMHREYLAYQMQKLQRMLFGRRSEKVPARTDGQVQLELFEEAKKEIQQEESEEREVIRYERKKRRGNRRPIPENIHRERVEIDVEPELRKCPDCGEEMVYIGSDVSEDLDYIPALIFVIEYVLRKYACKTRSARTGWCRRRGLRSRSRRLGPRPGSLRTSSSRSTRTTCPSTASSGSSRDTGWRSAARRSAIGCRRWASSSGRSSRP